MARARVNLVEVDGSMMEGEGQLLRMAVTYSSVLGVPIRVYNIRVGRKPPGLKPQHLATLKAVADISRAKTEGLSIGSREVTFDPRSPIGGDYYFDIGTAGSISLLLQCVAPIMAFASSSSRMRITGGTAVEWSPPIPILDRVVWDAARAMGFKGQVQVVREGFYPKGGGIAQVSIEPIKALKPLTLKTNFKADLVSGVSVCSRLPEHVAERQARAAEAILKMEGFKTKIDFRVANGRSAPLSPGSYICLWAEAGRSAYMGSDALGARGKPAEKVGAEAARELVDQLRTGANVDKHTADNLILWSSLAKGESSFTTSSLTMHTSTAIELAKKITRAEFSVEGTIGKQALITCNGIGLEADS